MTTFYFDGKPITLTSIKFGNGAAPSITLVDDACVTPSFQPSAEEIEMRAEMRAELLEAIRGALLPTTYAASPPEPIPTYEELKASWHRSMNPTPSERAANILNARNSGTANGTWRLRSGLLWSGSLEWLEIRRSAKRVKREAPAAYIEPGSFRLRA